MAYEKTTSDEQFSRRYGFFHSYAKEVIYRYLDCGHEYLIAFPCNRCHFCPSCHQKRVVEFREWLCMEVVEKVSHRHFVFSLPKMRAYCL